MAKLFYSMSGEGRGHAARVRAMVEHLRESHELTLFAPGNAYPFLAPLYAGTGVRVEPLPGLLFEYERDGRLDYRRTLGSAARYLRRFPDLLGRLRARIEEENPDLVITDFEPALARAARRAGVPFVSLNHQHFLLTYDLRTLPRRLRWHTYYIRWVVRSYYSGQAETIVSSFYFPPLRRGCRNVTQIGVLLRPEFERLQSADEGHLLVYCRRFAGAEMLSALRGLGKRVRIYGPGQQDAIGNLEFRAIDEARFMEDLATCTALLTTAGNQLVGEALYLGKPVLALPEPGNYEQLINAHFLRQSGCGEWVSPERLTVEVLKNFLGGLDDFRRKINREQMNGVPKALAVLRRCLAGGRPSVPAGRRKAAHA